MSESLTDTEFAEAIEELLVLWRFQAIVEQFDA